MGCCGSKNQVEEVDIVSKNQAIGVVFHEEVKSINDSNRNISSWIPESGAPKGIVLLSHGVNEHALCYYGIAIALVHAGYAVFGIDHVGHGLSEGRPGIIPDHNELVEDFVVFCTLKRQEYQHVPAFIVAHSMGTLVALKAINSIPDIKAFVLSGCAIVAGPGSASPFGIRCLYPLTKTSVAVCLTSVTATLDPAGPAAPLDLNGLTTSADELKVVIGDKRRRPPFVANRTAFELLKLIREVKEEVPKITLPFFLVHGGDDPVTLPESSEFVYKNAGTDITQRKMTIYPGLRHEVFHEAPPHGPNVIAAVVEFIESQYATVAPDDLTATSAAAGADAVVVTASHDASATIGGTDANDVTLHLSSE